MISKIKPYQSFRLILQTEFVRRCKHNSAYSMRAFAKFLEVDQSLLSKIMRNQRALSQENVKKMATKIGLSPSKVDLLLEKKTARKTFSALPDDAFNLISEWYHFAILELIKTKSFSSDYTVIAKRLGLHVDEIRAVGERLQRLGLISIKDEFWSLNKKDNSWSNIKTTTEARRLLQKSLTELSLKALGEIPFSHREHGSLTVAIDRRRLPEFKEKLAHVRKELGDFFQDGENFNEVYQLTLAFFPLTKIKEGDLK